jgi:hypothetical protein
MGLISVNGTYENKAGDKYVVTGLVEKTPKDNIYAVKFVNTGYTAVVKAAAIRNGTIKDRMKRSVAGVGYYGVGSNLSAHSREYRVWHNMINRCYNQKSTEWVHYGAKGVTVCSRWQCFSTFVSDLPSIPGYDKTRFMQNEIQLDKDKHSVEFKEYAPECCVFLPAQENNEVSRSISFKAVHESGEEIVGRNMARFCRSNGLSHGWAIQCMQSGKQYRGWKFLRLKV